MNAVLTVTLPPPPKKKKKKKNVLEICDANIIVISPEMKEERCY